VSSTQTPAVKDGPVAVRNVFAVPLDLLAVRPEFVVREHTEIESLAADIAAKGQLVPLNVRPSPTVDGKYEILNGHRRFAALSRLKAPSAVVRVLEADDKAALGIIIVENSERTDLNPVEEAALIRRATDEFGFTKPELAKAWHRSVAWVEDRLALAQLPKEVLNLVRAGELLPSVARQVVGLQKADQIQMATSAARNNESEKDVARERKRVEQRMKEERDFKEAFEKSEHKKCPTCKQPAKQFAYSGKDFQCNGYHTWNHETGARPSGQGSFGERKPSEVPSFEPTELRTKPEMSEWAVGFAEWIRAHASQLSHVEIAGYNPKQFSLDLRFKTDGPVYGGSIFGMDFETGEKSRVSIGGSHHEQRVRRRKELESWMRQLLGPEYVPKGGLIGVDPLEMKCPECGKRHPVPRRATIECPSGCGGKITCDTEAIRERRQKSARERSRKNVREALKKARKPRQAKKGG